MKLYVGNLPYTADDSSLRGLFEGFGEVHSARVVTDRDSGQSKGFGFVEMNDSDAQRAMGALMMHFMIETILAAGLLGIDPFDQPAVELGKRLARERLSQR